MTAVPTGIGALGAPQLEDLLRSFGIASDYIEFSGQVAKISTPDRLHMLQCMGARLSTADDVERLLLQQQQRLWGSLLPSMLCRGPQAGGVPVLVPAAAAGTALRWRLRLEEEGLLEGSLDCSTLPIRTRRGVGALERLELELPLPALPLGYHQLEVSVAGEQALAPLVVSPPTCWQPNGYADGKRWWGLSCQLYTLQSTRNWGIGDFADLQELIGQAAAAGASFVLLNPLHYLDLRYPENASPYSPSDRRFRNPLYLAPQLCEDVHGQAGTALPTEATDPRLQELRALPLVDYAGVAAVKLPVLAALFRRFEQVEVARDSARCRDFRAFCQQGGAALRDFAALQARLAIRPEPEFTRPEFHCYLQWLVEGQLADCQRLARQCGMALGLVQDLAVGSSADGAEVLGNPGLFCQEARIGAPPDNINPLGQNWGLPPLLPQALLQSHCAHFIALLRSNMQHCGALRIDHVMSLLRLWWCPNDGSNARGAYVHYPVDVLFAILRLESVRARCVVIGEDLGVVPPEIRGYLDGGGLYSNCVFYFEKYDGQHFRRPEHYKPQALMMLANHDVAPLQAWWQASDIPLRRRLGLIADEVAQQQEAVQREEEKGMLLVWLAELGLLPPQWQDQVVTRPLDHDLLAALFTACGRTASRLLSLQLDDLCGVDTPVNVPGTSSEYPNWRRKLPLPTAALFATVAVQQWLSALREARPQ